MRENQQPPANRIRGIRLLAGCTCRSDNNNNGMDGSALWIQTKPATVNFHKRRPAHFPAERFSRPGPAIRTSSRRIDRSSRNLLDLQDEVLCLEHLMETKSDSTSLVGELWPLIGLAANERQCTTNRWLAGGIGIAKKLEHIFHCSRHQSFLKNGQSRKQWLDTNRRRL